MRFKRTKDTKCKKCGSKSMRRKAWDEHAENPAIRGLPRSFKPNDEGKAHVTPFLRARKFNRIYAHMSS